MIQEGSDRCRPRSIITAMRSSYANPAAIVSGGRLREEHNGGTRASTFSIDNFETTSMFLLPDSSGLGGA
jgi:hypothetical protein